ncbi:SDR family NAD(P)-dependent oxidoreductase [uncultured Jatrophihabitans sp.]|uniref:SDR family NAD(P)-dependent oxidoreductase n=1 Tax=uncultured Jatrophihabitans sp. TaxID=1610747 RepID=UPI0035CB83E3
MTGAGAGLGQRYALDLAREGARVIVHSRRAEAAQATTDAIVTGGGSAVAVAADAQDGERIVEAAMAAYGRVDALIVNAGSVSDRSFARMTPDEWNNVVDVHLQGAFSVTRAAWPHLLEGGGGRIVLTTSGAGLHGNFGQANYAAAKAAIIGLAKTLAVEGQRRGILVNAVAPMALTGMTDDVFNELQRDALRAERVSPFVQALVHPRSRHTGVVMEVGGGWASVVRWERSAGLRLNDTELSADVVLDRWNEITDFTVSDYPTSTVDSLHGATGHQVPG